MCRRVIAGVAAVLLCGCFASDRDNLQDPVNTPILQMGSAVFDATDAAVVVSWSFIGQSQISEFVVERRITGQYEAVGSLSGTPGGRLERQSLEFRDTDVPAGERLFYRVSVPNEGTQATLTEARSLTIPGARLDAVTPLSSQGNIRVSWRPSSDVSYVGVFRLTGAAPQLVFETNDSGVRSFVDEGLQGNIDYDYYVTSLVAGVSLKSISVGTSLYSANDSVPTPALSGPGEKSFLIIPKLTSSRSILYLYHHGLGNTVERRYSLSSAFRNTGITDSGQTPQPREDRDLLPSSLSVDSPGKELRTTINTSQGVFEGPVQVYIGGITDTSNEIVLRAHTFSSFVGLSHRWPNANQASRTCLSTDLFSGTIYMSAGRELRVFDGAFAEAGEFEVPAEPTAIEIVRATLWMTARSPGRLFRGDLALSRGIPVSIDWSEIALPEGSDPVAMSSSRSEQLFILDVGLNRVGMMSSTGEAVLGWDLPDRSFLNGDIAVSSRGEVLVLDNAGTVYTYGP